MTDWVCLAQLGSGGFGIVHVWNNSTTGQVFALKKCKFGADLVLTARHKEAWVREVDIMLRLDHPGVVSCVPTPPGLDPGPDDLPTLCMEYCEQGDLRRELNKPESCRGLPEHQVLAILNDITSALGYLHNRRIIHRDLKPENIVMKKTEARTVYKLIDLGYAKELGVSSMAQSFVGTLQYVAPELFLGHDYTKSVDYWSLGLLCHEVVTGQRPFLPNMSPGHWIDHVERKKYEDISVVQTVEGEIRYLTQLCAETQISRQLGVKLEQWLRSLLDWRPETRGKDADENVIVFNQLNSILREKRVSIFSAPHGKMIHIVVRNGATGNSLISQITKEISIPLEHLLLLTPTGVVLSTNQIIDHGNLRTNQEPNLYLFTKNGKKSAKDYLQQSLQIPELVACFLKDARREVQDYHQKKMFIHGYHFVSDLFINLSRLTTGLKVLYKYMTDTVTKAIAECKQLEMRQEKMNARFELFKESLQHDQTRYQEQAGRKDRITSKKMVEHWTKTSNDLQQLTDEVTSRVSLVHETLEDLMARLNEQPKTKKVLTESSEDSELKGLVTKSLLLYSVLRKERPANREDTTARQIAQVVVKVLKRRDIVRMNCYTELANLTEFLEQVTDLGLAIQLLDKDFSHADAAISKAQLRRQSDVWTLLAAAVKHRPAVQLPQLDQTETNRIIQENETIRKQIEENFEKDKIDWDSI